MKNNNIRYVLVLLPFTVFYCKVNAQQIFKIVQLAEHNFIYSPAAAGAAEYSSIGASYRTMWDGIDGGPKTVVLFGDHYFSKPNIGIAPVLYSDKTGPTSRTGGQLNLSYSLDFSEKNRLMLGLGVNVMQYKIDFGKIGEYIPDDPLLASNGKSTKADASFGIYYRSSKFSGGISAQNLLQTKLGFIKAADVSTDGKLYRHYFGQASYRFVLDEDNVLTPNVLAQYLPNAPWEFKGGAVLEHKDLLSFGFNYWYRQLFSAQVGAKIAHRFSIGYAYEIYSTPISQYSTGGDAHEFMVRYFFVKK